MGLVVLAMHLAGVLAWWTLGYVPHARSGGALAPLTVWLPQLLLPAVDQLAQRTTPKASRQPDRTPSGRVVVAGPTNDTGVQPPSAPSAESTAVQESPPATPTLNLNLPRKALAPIAPAGPAALSPFHGRLPATVAQMIANAAVDAGPWTEERIDDDHFRLRRGNTCILLERPTAAALDPFSDAARRMPWRANGLCVP